MMRSRTVEDEAYLVVAIALLGPPKVGAYFHSQDRADAVMAKAREIAEEMGLVSTTSEGDGS